MTTYFHTAWSDGVTQYRASDMNTPLGTLDSAIYDVSGEAYHLHTFGMGFALQSNQKPVESGEISVVMPFSATFPSNLSSPKSYYYATVAPSGECVVSIKKAGVEFATLTVASGEASGGTFAGSATSIVSGERLSIVFPNTVDANWRGVTITLSGRR